MGSIVSHLADIIKLYGSYDNYVKETQLDKLEEKKKDNSDASIPYFPNPEVISKKEPDRDYPSDAVDYVIDADVINFERLVQINRQKLAKELGIK